MLIDGALLVVLGAIWSVVTRRRPWEPLVRFLKAIPPGAYRQRVLLPLGLAVCLSVVGWAQAMSWYGAGSALQLLISGVPPAEQSLCFRNQRRLRGSEQALLAREWCPLGGGPYSRSNGVVSCAAHGTAP